MRSPDNSFLSDTLARSPRRKTLKEQWWHIMDNWKVGIIPLPLFVLAGVLIALDCLSGKLASDIVVMVATLAFFGFACGEFGKRLPVVGRLGAAAICATFIPSALVYYGLLPDIVVTSTTQFHDRFAWEGHEFRRGRPVPREYCGDRYRIDDWRERGLREPPEGQHWADIDGNYVLIAAATGIITSLILNNAFH
ncbi:hypothetical protein DSJ_07935 [Pantoea stewartii subsp. stewartii DC283]|uniref:Citrate carrier protein n=1 Tax=Pantoea stewartii subsp. stewartii DC283 TaxID=660596 RepID=H3RAI3_PANSE|nr:hypothetical protein DSJ_07935 [Pantoea stewartii subsp. stewartii DC283]EHU01581.1 citrate carrier protein [Pantoea stewartii subsp. stewartii DC283]KAB0553366.1 hypothetical protein F7Q90_13400 [Pantoea stewartii subsp. stewartii]